MTRHAVVACLLLTLGFALPATSMAAPAPEKESITASTSCAADRFGLPQSLVEQEAVFENQLTVDQPAVDNFGEETGDVIGDLISTGQGSCLEQSSKAALGTADLGVGSQPCSGPGVACTHNLNCFKQCQLSGCDPTYSWCAGNVCYCDAI